MMNPKFLLISAAVGFTASFAAGIIGNVFFGVIVLRSLLFALCAAAAAFGLRTLAVKFLFPVDDSILPEQSSAPVPGTSVDITLDDGELGDDGAMLNFSFQPVTIGQPAQSVFAPQDKHREASADETSSSATVLPPVSEVKKTVPAVAPAPVAETTADSDTRQGQGTVSPPPDLSSGSEILPDLEAVTAGFDVSPAAGTPQGADTPIDLIDQGGGQDFDGRPDASEMVKAIRTVLSKDD